MDDTKVVPKERCPTSTNGATDEAPTRKRTAAKTANRITIDKDETDDEVAEPVTPKGRAPRKKVARGDRRYRGR